MKKNEIENFDKELSRMRKVTDSHIKALTKLREELKEKVLAADYLIRRLEELQEKEDKIHDNPFEFVDMIEQKLDEINGQKGSAGNLCILCGSRKHNGRVGIVHENDCPIKIIREWLKKTH